MNDQELRKWVIEQSIDHNGCGSPHDQVMAEAQAFYDFVTKSQTPQFSTKPAGSRFPVVPFVLIVSAFLLSGCSFTLGMVNLPPGTTQAQRDTAILVCKDWANQQNAESGKAAAEFALGASLIGFPAGVQMEIDAKREAFTKCMNARGYQVRPPA